MRHEFSATVLEELIGRIQLWMNALIDSQQSLGLANRLTDAASHVLVVAEQSNFEAFFNDATGRRYDPHVAHVGDQEAIARFRPSLPTPGECHLSACHLRKVAIVYMAQVYSSGNHAAGSVAANKSDFGKELRQELASLAFPDEPDRIAFGETMNRVLRLRDKHIGHADGSEFGVRHEGQSVASTIEPVPIDLHQELLRVLPRLVDAAHTLIGDLLRKKGESPASS